MTVIIMIIVRRSATVGNMVTVTNKDYCEAMIEIYFSSGCQKDIDTLKDLTDNLYSCKFGKQFSKWKLEHPITNEQEQYVLNSITDEE